MKLIINTFHFSGETDKAERSAEEMMETYQKSFERIKEVTGESDMNVLVKKFLETEDKNFALFNYINELNRELELVEEQIEKTRNQIRQYNEEGVQYQTERQNVLKNLEKKLEETTKEAERYDM